jgi:hypothetical protein
MRLLRRSMKACNDVDACLHVYLRVHVSCSCALAAAQSQAEAGSKARKQL